MKQFLFSCKAPSSSTLCRSIPALRVSPFSSNSYEYVFVFTLFHVQISISAEKIKCGKQRVRNISGKLFDATVSALKDGFDRAVENAGIKNLHFHDLRHTFATRLVQMGVDLYKVQKLMGHRTIRMTERYAHHTPESLKPAALALDNYYNFTTVTDNSGSEMSQDVVKCFVNQ